MTPQPGLLFPSALDATSLFARQRVYDIFHPSDTNWPADTACRNFGESEWQSVHSPLVGHVRRCDRALEEFLFKDGALHPCKNE